MPNYDITEDRVEDYLRSEGMQHHAMVLKMGTRYNGFPDRIVLWGMLQLEHITVNKNLVEIPVVDFPELKRPVGGKFEPLQQRWHDKLRSMGYLVPVLHSKQQVDEYISMRVAQLLPNMRKLRGGVPMSLAPFIELPRRK